MDRPEERYSFSRIPKYDYRPGARLTVKVTNGFPHRQSNWSDGTRQSVEGVLAQVMQEIELRAERAEQDRLKEERRRLEERRLWEVAMERAREDFAHSFRAETLMGQAKSWRLCRDLNGYVEAMRATVALLPNDATRSDAEAQTSWSSRRVGM
jgi:hypothetical protein